MKLAKSFFADDKSLNPQINFPINILSTNGRSHAIVIHGQWLNLHIEINFGVISFFFISTQNFFICKEMKNYSLKQLFQSKKQEERHRDVFVVIYLTGRREMSVAAVVATED